MNNLTHLYLDYNQISDISPLVANVGLAAGDMVWLRDNPLSADSLYIYIPELEARGVAVYSDNTTPSGEDVVVSPVDSETGENPVPITFDNIAEGGSTSLDTTTEGDPPPSGFMLGDPPTYYEIETTADYSGPIKICINYSGMSLAGNEEDLRLYHFDGSSWIPIADQTVDTENNLIYGTVSHLSAFAIFEPISVLVEEIYAPVEPVEVNTVIEDVSANFTDPDNTGAHTAVWDWGDGNKPSGTVTETNGSGSVTDNHTYTIPGVYTITLTVRDSGGGAGLTVFKYVVVYDPEGGFVTGGGWIDSPEGAYSGDPNLTGKATFGFVSKYKKGASFPTGNTEFQFKAGDLNFHSSSYEWLVVTGSDYARFKGTGTINNDMDPQGNPYKFMLWAGDDDPDTFRIKIWYEFGDTEVVIYDNGMSQPIGGGNIVVHTSKK